jgi:hypothetical protein
MKSQAAVILNGTLSYRFTTQLPSTFSPKPLPLTEGRKIMLLLLLLVGAWAGVQGGGKSSRRESAVSYGVDARASTERNG